MKFLTKIITIAIMVFPVFIFSPFVDSDIFWHLKTAEEVVKEKTIIDHAVNTFPEKDLPYINHETGYQLTALFFYSIAGWKGIYTLNLIAFFLFILGSIRLVETAKQDFGIKNPLNLSYFLLLPYLFFFLNVFTGFKTFVLSLTIVPWFFIFLREFSMKRNWKSILKLSFLSLLLSNFHGGLWLIIFVFTIMAMVDFGFSKSIKKKEIAMFILVAIGGLLNSGGINTILYTMKVGEYKTFLSSFQPISFSGNPVFFVLLFVFLVSAIPFIKKSVFHFFFILGLVFLGVSSYYTLLYMIVFIPYFLTGMLENVSFTKKEESIFYTFNRSILIKYTVIGLIIQLLSVVFFVSIKIPKNDFPVEEMNFISKDYKGDSKPKVLSEYNSSGYVTFKDGLVFADSRLDPFITKDTKGINGWTAAQQIAYAYKFGFVTDVSKEINPDYVIIPKTFLLPKNSPTSILLKEKMNKFGKPVFVGKFGYVYDCSKIKKQEH